jgi:uncharacterized membrane protein
MITSNSTLIDAPTPVVFKILMDIELATVWVPYLVKYEVISKTRNMVGSTYRSHIDYDGLKYELMSEIIHFVENETVEWRSSCKFCDGRTSYYLTTVSDTQTEFKFVTACKYKGLTKIWSWLAKSKFKKASEMYIEETFKNFKMLVEVEYTSQCAS